MVSLSDAVRSLAEYSRRLTLEALRRVDEEKPRDETTSMKTQRKVRGASIGGGNRAVCFRVIPNQVLGTCW